VAEVVEGGNQRLVLTPAVEALAVEEVVQQVTTTSTMWATTEEIIRVVEAVVPDQAMSLFTHFPVTVALA
jgi:hypothetical protein